MNIFGYFVNDHSILCVRDMYICINTFSRALGVFNVSVYLSYASILLYGCTTWTLTKRMEKKLDGNYIRMLRTILNKSWRQHPAKQQLYSHLPLITKNIKIRWTRHAVHCWRSRDELISDVLLWASSCGRAKAGRRAQTYIQQLGVDTGCSPEDLQEAMNDREGWREAQGYLCWWQVMRYMCNFFLKLKSVFVCSWMHLVRLCLMLV